MVSGGSDSSSSKPLTGAQRSDIFDYGLSDITSSVNDPAFNIQYNSPQFQSSGGYQSLSGGDYDALESAIYSGSTAGLKQFETDERARVDQDASNRGIWSSGLASQLQGDVTDSLAPSYMQAGANATAQRYGMEAQDLAGLNAYNQSESTLANQFAANNAAQEFSSQWMPLEYLQGLYNQTGGAVTSGKATSFGLL